MRRILLATPVLLRSAGRMHHAPGASRRAVHTLDKAYSYSTASLEPPITQLFGVSLVHTVPTGQFPVYMGMGIPNSPVWVPV